MCGIAFKFQSDKNNSLTIENTIQDNYSNTFPK